MTRLERHWLRPVWYTTDLGPGLTMGTARRGTIEHVGELEPHPRCTRCGKDCLDIGGYAHLSGYLCFGCNEIVNPYVQPKGLNRLRLAVARRTTWRLASGWDALYWRYCHRFGKRSPL